MQPNTTPHILPPQAASSVRVLSTETTAAIAKGALARLTHTTCPRVLVFERGGRHFAVNLNLVESIEPRLWNSSHLRGHIPDLKLPSPLAPLTDSTRDIILSMSGVNARIGADRLVSTHNLNLSSLADPQELIPSGWLLGYFDQEGTTVALIDPSALLPVRYSAPFAA